MKSSGIGGQAVLEGVMMKNHSQYAVAVRTPDGKIVVQKDSSKSVADRALFFRLPIIRGVVAFVESLMLGLKTLTYSSSLYEEEEEKQSRDRKQAAGGRAKDGKKEETERKETLQNILIVCLSIILAVAFFMLLPFFLSELLRPRIASHTVLAVIEGALRILLFVGYVAAISLMSDIKRVFMYHGAEHKTINCIEKGLDLNVANVKKQSCYHRRCGTSFLLIVMFISVIFFVFIHISNIWLRMAVRILLVPVIAGVSYEFIRLAGSSDHPLVSALSKPGMLLQRLTTREPEDDMIEVAIQSVEAVFDWKAYQHRCRARQERESQAGNAGKASARPSRKSRAQQRRELQEREQNYRRKAMERAQEQKEQEEREMALEERYQKARRRHEARQAAMAEKVEPLEDESLNSLDHFLDEAGGDPAREEEREEA